MIQKSEESRNIQSPAHFPGIDLIKFCCAFLVLAIHVSPFQDGVLDNGETLKFLFKGAFCRIAVPFFFTASGFFLFRNMDLRNVDFERIRNYSFKILRLFGLWSLLLFAGENYHLWYLKATVVAVILVGLCFRWRWNAALIAALALVLYGVGLLGDSYYGFLDSFRSMALVRYAIDKYEFFFKNTRNGLFMGFPFVLIGVWFARKRVRIKPVFAAVGFVCSMVLLILEAFLLESRGVCKAYNMYVMLIPANIFLFELAVSVELKGKAVYEKLRAVGALVYYMHLMSWFFVELVFYTAENYTGIELQPFVLPATAVSTLLAALVIYRLSQHEKLRWLRYLYQ